MNQKGNSLVKISNFYHYLNNLILHKQPVRFMIVGGLAFVVNILVLYFLHGILGLYLLLSQAIAAELSIVVSFLLHHHWTYKNKITIEKHWRTRFLHFNTSALGGTLIASSTLIISVHIFKINYLIGLSIGAIIALIWNYFANQKLVWK